MNVFNLITYDLGTFFDRVVEAGLYALLGMGVIFLVLCLIWGILAIFNLIFANKRDVDRIFDGLPAEVVDDPTDEEDDETVVAITAAVLLLLREEAKAENRAPNKFRVVAFRRAAKRIHRN